MSVKDHLNKTYSNSNLREFSVL